MLLALENVTLENAPIMEYRKIHKKDGFSLMELAIAIALVLGIMYYMINSTALFSSSDSMNVKQDMENLTTYIKTYSSLRKDHRCPATLDELLEDIPASDSTTGRDEGAVIDSNRREAILDPWGNEYIYTLETGERSGSITSTLGGTGEYTVKF